jgi:hypothetical protein
MAKPKQKRKSLLQSQREKLARQRAARRAAQRANQQIAQSTRRSLPAKGRTTATSPRARVQRGLTRDRLAKQQLQNFGRALQRTMKQRQAQNKLDQAAKGTKGGQTRTAGGAGQLARRGGGSSSPTSQRIQPVRVRVEGQKQLPGAKKPAGQLPAGKPKLKPASGGSSGSLPGGSGARKLLKAGARGVMGKLGAAALAAEGVSTAKSLADSLRRGEGYAALPGLNKRLNQGIKGASGGRATVKPKKKETKPNRGEPIRNRRGRVVGYKPVKPARRGMSNLPSGYKEDEKRLSQAARPNSTKPSSGNGGGGGSKPATKPVKKTKPKLSGIGPIKSGQGYATAVTGKSKTQRDAEELRKMQERSRARQAEMKKKKKKY